MSWLSEQLKKFTSAKDKQLAIQLEHLLGFKPKYLPYYKLAFMHRSRPDDVENNNERLEFLGDAILGAIVAEHLFKKYPHQDEGYLTELRSRIVRRESLNAVATRMGINKLVVYNKSDRSLTNSHIFGNALEALIGAIYLDQGFTKTKKFIQKDFLAQYINLEDLANNDTNYKNRLLSWAQKNGHSISFDSLEESIEKSRRLFCVGVCINGEIVATGNAFSKKDAGQVAAKKAIEVLAIS